MSPEHWLRIEQALHGAAAHLYRTGNTEHARRYQHTRQLIQHVTAPWNHTGGLEVLHSWESEA
jgi:hypothetical protein